jgi:hypothetical protein
VFSKHNVKQAYKIFFRNVGIKWYLSHTCVTQYIYNGNSHQAYFVRFIAQMTVLFSDNVHTLFVRNFLTQTTDNVDALRLGRVAKQHIIFRFLTNLAYICVNLQPGT